MPDTMRFIGNEEGRKEKMRGGGISSASAYSARVELCKGLKRLLKQLLANGW